MHNVCGDIMRKMEVNIGESNSLCSPVTIPLSVVAGTLLEHLRTTSYRALRSNGLSCDFGHRQIPQLDMCSPMCSSCCLQVIDIKTCAVLGFRLAHVVKTNIQIPSSMTWLQQAEQTIPLHRSIAVPTGGLVAPLWRRHLAKAAVCSRP